jgi:kumamolisin
VRWIALPESGPHHGTGIVQVPGRPNPDQVIRATVVLRSRCPEGQLLEEFEHHNRLPPADRPQLTLREFNHRYAPLRSDVGKVVLHARANGLRVREIDSGRHAVVLSGTLGQFAKAFHVEFSGFQFGATRFIGHTTPISVPSHLTKAVVAVLGFDDRPLSRPHAATDGRARGILPDEIARAYAYPTTHKLRRQTIAIMLPYGGFRHSDLRTFFAKLGRRPPRIHTLCVEGRRNQPAPLASLRQFCSAIDGRPAPAPASHRLHGAGSSAWNVLWSVEAALDIQLAGALAPRCDLLVCFLPDTPRGKFEGFTRAMTHPTRPTVVSASWSAHEHDVPPMLRRVLDHVFMFASLRNITICCSSGDDGGAAGERDQVHFPASSPYVLACGGTTFAQPETSRHERVWNERVGGRPMSTSGGFSRTFPRPRWQDAHVKFHHRGSRGRAVPDVAAKADFKRGYRLVVGGREIALGGTSAATPAWAALIACVNDAMGSAVGFITPQLYRRGARSALRSVTVGTNGTYRATEGWDPCTGLGTPHGEALLDLLTHAGAPKRALKRRARRRSAGG